MFFSYGLCVISVPLYFLHVVPAESNLFLVQIKLVINPYFFKSSDEKFQLLLVILLEFFDARFFRYSYSNFSDSKAS